MRQASNKKKAGSVKHNAATSGGDAASIAALHKAFERQKKAFLADPYPGLEERKANLDKLCGMLLANRERIRKAMAQDFAVHHGLATDILEILKIVDTTVFVMSSLENWMRDEVREVDANMWGNGKAVMRYQPKGVIGNIVPWNFPLEIAFGCLAEMLASGNRVIIKPSDIAPACSDVIRDLVKETYDPDLVTVVTGGLSLAKEFITLPWDHLMYTGNPRIGREVMKAAAANLVPVTLELGGKCPAILMEDTVNMDTVRQVIGIKTIKNGQLCISVDYCLVPRKSMDKFVQLAKQYVHDSMPDYSRTENCTGIINEHHFDRLLKLLDQAIKAGCKVIELEEGCVIDRPTRRIPIMLVLDPGDELGIMQEEIFGPIVPVKPYDTLEQAINFVNTHERPLALYVFGHDQEKVDKVITMTSSGGVSVNCCMMHATLPSVGFGGSGMSGMGYHHGIEGFREYSKLRGVFVRGDQPDIIEMTFAPYGEKLANFVNPWFG
jgi:coniferyl-aldehyde dehydrogenase